MVVSRMIVNAVATKLVKHFKLEKIMSYVFDDNELDLKVKHLDGRISVLEKSSHPPREFVICEECKKKIKEGD